MSELKIEDWHTHPAVYRDQPALPLQVEMTSDKKKVSEVKHAVTLSDVPHP
jgi:hypothetical protein